MERKNLYNENMTRIHKAIRKEETPDRVPVVLKLYNWVIEYYGADAIEFYSTNFDIASELYNKAFDEFGYDGLFNTNNVTPINATKCLGGGLYELSQAGLQVSNLKANIMEETDYSLIAEDFIGYLRDYILPRRFPKFSSGTNEEALKALQDSYAAFGSQMGAVIKNTQEIEAYGCPVVWARGAVIHPVDFIMDYLIDFSGIMKGIRRNFDLLKEACDNIQAYVRKNVLSKFVASEDGHGPFWPMHLAPYLNPKDFEKIYYPYFKESVEYCIENKIYLGLFMEGSWKPYYDLLQDLPDNSYLIGSMEFGDYKEFKERLGKKMALCGGIPLNLLSHSTKEECVDFTKKLIDDCADGGGFIVDTDKSILNLRDAKPENLKAVIDTVQAYGKYE